MKKPARWIRTLLPALVLAGCALDGADGLDGEDGLSSLEEGVTGQASYVARLGFGGLYDTDVAFTELYPGSFAMMAWVMPEFTYNSKGPLFASTDDTFEVGQGNYADGNGGFMKEGDPVLTIRVGSKRARYLAPGYLKGQWNHLALVRGDTTTGDLIFRLYLNGGRLVPFVKSAGVISTTSDITFPPGTVLASPPGKVRIGRTLSGVESGVQLYALLDEVQIFNRELSGNEVQFYAGRTPTGIETGLVAAWSFEPAPAGIILPPKLARPLTSIGPVDRMTARGHKDLWSGLDYMIFSDPKYVLKGIIGSHHLPFTPGEVWRVTQGNDNPASSHNGSGDATFSFDFSNGAYAVERTSADGMISGYISDPGPRPACTSDSCEQEQSKVHVKIGNHTWNTYIHLAYHSFIDVFYGGSDPLFPPQESMPWTWVPVAQGAIIGVSGPNARHLHYATYNEDGTIPSAFVSYWQSTDKVNWTFVSAGRPREGTWVTH